MIFGREKHTVNGQRPGQWVHESVVPQVSLSLETYRWNPRVRFNQKKKKGLRFNGLEVFQRPIKGRLRLEDRLKQWLHRLARTSA